MAEFVLKSDTPYTEDGVLITPDVANLILEHNTLNRPISQRQVDEYADQMKRGLWELNGEPIILSKEGLLLDGQHRLWACTESNRPFRTDIKRGVDKSTFHTIDTGKKRSGGDVLAIHSKLNGEALKYPQQVSAAATICLEYQRGVLKHKGRGDSKISRADLVVYIENHPQLEQWILRSKVKKDWATAYSASIAAVCYLGSKKYEMKAVDFMYGFITGEDLKEGSPILALRRRLGMDKRMFKWERLALMIHAFKAFVDNRDLTILKPPKGEIPLIPGTEPKEKVKVKPVPKQPVPDIGSKKAAPVKVAAVVARVPKKGMAKR